MAGKVAERKAKEEKLRRLKNAKREELERKMKQVKAVLGAKVEAKTTSSTESGTNIDGENKDNDRSLDRDGVPPMDEAAIMKLLEGDYDPEKFEKHMQEAFGDDFYEKEDEEWKTDEDVRKTLRKDGDLPMEDYDDYDADGGDGEEEDDFDDDDDEDEAERGEDRQEDGYYGEEGEDGYDQEEDHREETPLERKVRAKLTDKLYELDYEDIVAGMPTRFKYREVEPNDFGLSTEEILLARDSTLKQFVSLKKMAPYNEGGEYQVSSRKRRKFREMLQQDIEDAEKRMKEQGITVNNNHSTEDGGDVDPDASGKKKRRRRIKKKGEKEKAAKSQENQPQANGDNDDVDEGEKNEGKKKRRRKKKGKKISAVDASKPHSTDTSKLLVSPDKQTAGQDAEKPVLEKQVVDKANDSSKSRDKSQKKKKKKKKKSKDKTTLKVEGVSASRLASYGL